MSTARAAPAAQVGGPWSGVAHGLLLALAACSYFSIALMQILVGLVTLAWAWDRWRVRRPAPLPLLVPFAVFFVVSVISALRGGGLANGIDALGEALPPIVFFLTLDVCAQRGRVARSLHVVVISAVLAAALGLAQTVLGGAELRISGSLSHYMTYSGLLMLAFAVALALWIRGARGARVRLALALFAIAAALLMTQTRGAWLGCAVAAAIVLGSWKPRALLLLPLVGALAYLLAPAVVQQRIRSMFDLSDITAIERVYMWRAGLAMVADQPLLGVGPAQVRARYDEYRLPDDPRPQPRPPGHLHNNLINLAAERGLVGLACWLAIWLAFFWRLARIWRRAAPDDVATRSFLLATLAAMGAFHCMGLFEFNYGDSEVVTLALFLMALPFAAARVAGIEGDGAPSPQGRPQA